MGVLDDPNVGPPIIVMIVVVGICCSVCISNGIENCLNNLHEQEIERRRQERQRNAGQASVYHAVPALPTLAVDIVRECA